MDASAFGINGGWGIRTTAALLISSVKTQQILQQFYRDGQTKEIKNI
jgi:hypothetical protein